MKENEPKVTQSPALHLTLDDFSHPPVSLEDFKVGDRLTRDNFLSFLVLSFSVSRGHPTKQAEFLHWLRSMTGFDYFGSLEFFRDRISPEDVLTDEEKFRFTEAFSRVSGHKKTHFDPIFSLKTQIIILLDDKDTSLRAPESVKTLSDFKKYVNDYHQNLQLHKDFYQ